MFIRWTPEKLEELRVDSENKIPVNELAERYGVSRQRIYQLLTKYSMETPKLARKKRMLSVEERTIYRLLLSISSNCSRSGIPFDLTVDDFIPVPLFCPILGIKLDFKEKGRGERRESSPSVDRIIPELGYTKGNVAVISWRANRIKNNGTWEEHEKIAEFVKKWVGL